MGFGVSFYGFFLAAAIWMCVYFAWVAAVDRMERRRSHRD
jgi:hypothetical protein